MNDVTKVSLTVITVAAIFIGGPTYCNVKQALIVQGMVKNGANPHDAACALARTQLVADDRCGR